MAIPDPPKAGSPFCALWTGGWNPKTPKINNFFIPEITLRGGYGTTARPGLLRFFRDFPLNGGDFWDPKLPVSGVSACLHTWDGG